MSDIAVHLVDDVFPEVPVRQWVLAFPHNLRYLFAYNKKALTKALEIAIRSINRYYKDKGKLKGVGGSKPGSVTLIQRFGSALNLNIHFHILYPDGVWDKEGKFHGSVNLQDEDVERIVGQIKTRVMRSLTKKGYIDGYNVGDNDELALEFPGLAESTASSIKRKNNQGGKLEEFGKHFDLRWMPNQGKLCYYDDGFSLHAKTTIPANDRQGLEHLCRYIARPAISNDRLAIDEDGSVTLKLKTPFNNGTTHIRFTGEEFMHKLIPLVPPPWANLTRYHGALGPNSKIRKKIVQRNKAGAPKEKKQKYKTTWAKLLKRVFGFELEGCPCGGQLKIISAILDQGVAVKIMECLQIEVFIPSPDPPRTRDFFDSA